MLENTIIAALRTRLLAVLTVPAVHLVAAATKAEAGDGLVAYVVGGQRKALEPAIADSGYPGSVALVRVHALPLRPRIHLADILPDYPLLTSDLSSLVSA